MSGTDLLTGFGENVRILKWIIQRATRSNPGGVSETPIGWIPERGSLDISGLPVPEENFPKLFAVNQEEWKVEMERALTFLAQFGERMPREIWQEFHNLEKSVEKSG